MLLLNRVEKSLTRGEIAHHMFLKCVRAEAFERVCILKIVNLKTCESQNCI